MIAFDIETTGLKANQGDRCTIVCAEDWLTREKFTFEFERHRDDPETSAALLCQMCKLFDEAPSLAAFNGIKFDIPFLQQCFNLQPAQTNAWALKTVDIYDRCKKSSQPTFSLNMLCEANGVPTKISSGCEAIGMAERGEWTQLREYCAMDVTILNNLADRRLLIHPRTHNIIDLALWSPAYVYPETEHETPEQVNKRHVDAKTFLLQSLAEKEQALVAAQRAAKLSLHRPDLSLMLEVDDTPSAVDAASLQTA